MPLVNPVIVKRHLRVDFDDNDSEIAMYQAAAESIVVEYVDRIVLAEGVALPGPDDENYDEFTMNITPAITAAILLLVGDLYENREADPDATGNVVLPKAVRSLLAPWRVWRTLDEKEVC